MNTQRTTHPCRNITFACVAALVLAAALQLVAHTTAWAASNLTLSFNQTAITQIGKQAANSQACLDFCYAYAESIVDGRVHSWTEYDYYGGKNGQTGAAARLVNGYTYKKTTCDGGNDSANWRYVYNAINAGHPVIVQVSTKYSGWHWAVVVGYQNVGSANSLKASNFLMLDPAYNEPSTPISMADCKFLHNDSYGDIRISTRTVGTHGAEETSDLGSITRLAGNTRYATMASIVGAGFSSSSVAILTTGENYPDALAASALAGVYDAPIILTSTGQLSGEARTKLSNLGVKKAFILGGASAVGTQVESAVQGMGISTVRLAGNTRQDTSVEIFNTTFMDGGGSHTVIIAAGNSFADALSISPYAYAVRAPILLTGSNGKLTTAEINAIKSEYCIKNIVIVGGTSVVSDAVKSQLGKNAYNYTRLSGNNRYETSAAIANWELENGLDASVAAVSTGTNFPDALAGAALSGSKNGILLLAASGFTDQAAGVLSARKGEVSTLYVYGGTNAVSHTVANTCARALQ